MKIIVSGPVIIQNGKLLVIKEDKDNFYKIPGGRVEGKESLEETCKREVSEEINGDITIIKKLSTMRLDRNPQTGKEIKIPTRKVVKFKAGNLLKSEVK